MNHTSLKSMRRWSAAVGVTVVASVIVALLLGVQQTMYDQTAQIATLTQEVMDLRSELADIPSLRSRVDQIQERQVDLAQSVNRIEAHQK